MADGQVILMVNTRRLLVAGCVGVIELAVRNVAREPAACQLRVRGAIIDRAQAIDVRVDPGSMISRKFEVDLSGGAATPGDTLFDVEMCASLGASEPLTYAGQFELMVHARPEEARDVVVNIGKVVEQRGDGGLGSINEIDLRGLVDLPKSETLHELLRQSHEPEFREVPLERQQDSELGVFDTIIERRTRIADPVPTARGPGARWGRIQAASTGASITLVGATEILVGKDRMALEHDDPVCTIRLDGAEPGVIIDGGVVAGIAPDRVTAIDLNSDGEYRLTGLADPDRRGVGGVLVERMSGSSKDVLGIGVASRVRMPCAIMDPAAPSDAAFEVENRRGLRIEIGGRWAPLVDGAAYMIGGRVWTGVCEQEVTTYRRPSEHAELVEETRLPEIDSVGAMLRERDQLEAEQELDRFVEHACGMQFALVPAGRFRMGSDNPGLPSTERPAREAEIARAFYVGVRPVTRREIDALRDLLGAGRVRDLLFASRGPFASPAPSGAALDLPVTNVSAREVDLICEALAQTCKAGARYRLPTESEWEFSARGGSSALAWFDESEASSLAVFGRDGPKASHPIRANPIGLLDVIGNVEEWTASAYDGKPGEREAREGQALAIRGGSWQDRSAAMMRVTRRASRLPISRASHLGCRIVREIPDMGRVGS